MPTVRDNSGQRSSSVDACRVPRRPVISGISHTLRRPWVRWTGRHWNEAAADPCNEDEALNESGGDGMLPKTPEAFSSVFHAVLTPAGSDCSAAARAATTTTTEAGASDSAAGAAGAASSHTHASEAEVAP